MTGLPGAYDRYDVPGLRTVLDTYGELSAAGLRENLRRFLRAVLPAAISGAVSACVR